MLRRRTDVLQETQQLGAEVRRQQLVRLIQHQQRRAMRLRSVTYQISLR